MPVDETLIPDPVLDPRSEAEIYVQALNRTVGNYTTEDVDLYRETADIIEDSLNSGIEIPEGNLPEISSPRPAEVVPTLLRAWAMMMALVLYYFNQIPNKVRINLLRLLGVELRPAVAATTTLRFTKTTDFLNIEVIVPAGTDVLTEDRRIRVATVEDLVIPAATASATVQARAVDEGDIAPIKPNTIGFLITSVAGISSVTNTTSLTGGVNAETVDQGKVRAREEFRIGQHLGSVNDFETYIYFETLRRKGRVTGFERYLSDFSQATLGYLLLIIQGADGLAPNQTTLDAVSAVVNQRHVAGIYVSVRGPIYKQFSILANVKITQGQSAATLIKKAKSNLAAFYNPLTFPYGVNETERYISISDIVGRIEAASPQGISVKIDSIVILIGDLAYNSDILLSLGELPLLENVALTVVN